MQCISRHLQLTLVESALCCSCLEPLFSLGSQTACTQCTSSTLPGVIVPGTGSQPSYTASSEQAPIHFTAEKSKSGTTYEAYQLLVSLCLHYFTNLQIQFFCSDQGLHDLWHGRLLGGERAAQAGADGPGVSGPGADPGRLGGRQQEPGGRSPLSGRERWKSP